MRWLAEYVMRGRRQAISVVLLCGFLPMLYFISAAVVGLVTLRKGWYEGFLILLWSLLPALVLWQMGDSSPLFVMLGTMVLALLLRASSSWQQAILAGAVLGLLTQLSLYWQTGYINQLETIVAEVMNAQSNQGAEVQYTAQELVGLLLQFYGAYHGLAMILCLMLARWWQAALYNPGGFGQEFHWLRFDPRIMLGLLALIVAGMLGVSPLSAWLAVLSIPPMLGGLAVLHGMIALKKMGGHWLILCYLILVMMSPAVIALGLMDSVFDFRKRMIT